MGRRFQGKVVLITGGSEGIGYETAKLFTEEGACVYITGRRQEKLQEAVEMIGKCSQINVIQADASIIGDLDHIYHRIENDKGYIDIIFANAGYFEVTPLESLSEAVFDKIYNTNVKGVVFLIQKMLPLFRDHGGSIILNGSVISIKGLLSNSVYTSSKAALRALVRGWSIDLKERNIRVNVVSPGPIDTPAVRNAHKNEKEQKQLIARLEAATVLGRIGRADEVAKTVLFLASEDSSYITGIELFVDGGMGQI